MTSSNDKIERIAFGSILCVALLMFYQPIIRLHGPNGSQVVTDVARVRSELTQWQSNLRMVTMFDSSPNRSSSVLPITETASSNRPLAMPFSLRTAPQVRWFMVGAMICCLFAVADLVLFRKTFAAFSLLGGCLSAIALLHVLLMGSDVQSWLEMFMNNLSQNSLRDPGLGGRMMMANSFSVSPGFGLEVLTGCLLLVPVLSSTRGIPRMRSVLRHERRVHISQPILVRPLNSKFREEICTSVDLSKEGLLLETASNHYYVGMEVYLSRNSATGSPETSEEHGSVVRVEKRANGKCHLGIHLIPQV